MKKIFLSGRIAKIVFSQNRNGEECVYFDLAVTKTARGKENTQFFRFYGNAHFAEVCRKCKAEKGTVVRNVMAEPSVEPRSTGKTDSEGRPIEVNELLCFIEDIEFGYAGRKEQPKKDSYSAAAAAADALDSDEDRAGTQADCASQPEGECSIEDEDY